ncbi:hypothetical protein AGR56_08900 [Clostridium sp. DMHC 10]|uniref:polysaccharide deacetylase family protein n=1 Tax=Clostridium sp. DMHC 10 TaxID=747377 RepID=UPI00069EDF1A|nr:polysaccharide deacetylase family protein [Clostridium sp. DMHC 10]KOF56780.1 hypothetical protein AGR56_08900 [Clostridium sp. DMHC 10]
MKNVVANRRLDRRKVFFTRISFIFLMILFVSALTVSFTKRKIETNSYLSNKVVSSTKKHKPSSAKKSAVVVLRNQISNSGTKAEDAYKEDGKKTAYLTFDDGPSTTVTPRILDILKVNGVHATFFLMGKNIEKNSESENLVKRIYNEGNAIGDHTYSHSLKKLYPHNVLDVSAFMNEVDETQNILKSILGPTFFTRVIRMPGGYMSRKYYKDPNLGEFDNILKQRNMVSIDWNAYDFDAEGRKRYASGLLDKVKSTVQGKNKVVILMHDTYGKEETAKALPDIIQYLKEQGYEFDTLK